MRREGLEKKLEGWEERDRWLEEVIEKVESWEKQGRRGKGVVEEGQMEEWGLRMRRMEVMQDKKEREGRRNNVVVRGVVTEGREVGEEIRKLWGRMGLERGDIKEVVWIGKAGGGGSGMVLVKMAGRDEKRKVMEARKNLKGGRERIDDDLTEEERRGKWKIEREAERERESGKNVRIGYMKMWVNGRMKKWDEVYEKWIEEQGNEGRANGGGGRG